MELFSTTSSHLDPLYLIMGALKILLLLPILLTVQTEKTTDPFYIIAHMANSIPSLDWAVAEGANGIENDLQFDGNGNPTIFEHGGTCDCICAVTSGHICTPLLGKCSGTGANSDAASHMQHVARLNSVALFLIDSKVDAKMGATLAKAGSAIVPFVDRHLFGSGYQGKVIIGSAKIATFDYVRAAAIAASKSPNNQSYFFTFDEEKDDYIGVMDMLSRFTNNRVFGTGISSCWIGTYYDGIRAGVAGRKSGQNGLTYIWTLDSESSMRNYIDSGVHAIMTNRVSVAKNLAISMGLRIAQTSDPIPISSASVPQQNKCDCDYHSGGCTISRPPPSGKACKCVYKGLWTCGGDVVNCNNAASEFCTNPDLSPGTCIQGGGDCDGYSSNQSCDCSYIKKGFFQQSGCKITRPAVANVACRCKYHALWRCSGSPTSCSASQPKCANPDTSKEACQVGGGDCDGY